MTIALSVGTEHFPCSTAFAFNFNPNWMLFNNRGNRKGVIRKFTDVIDTKGCILVERTLVHDGECKSEWFIFTGAVMSRGDIPKFWDESRQCHNVDGVWKSLGPLSYRLRFIAVDGMKREPYVIQPFAGASLIDSTVVQSIMEDLRVGCILNWIDRHSAERERGEIAEDILAQRAQRQ